MREISPKTMWIHNSNNSCTDLQSHNFIPTSNKYYNNFGRVFMPKISIPRECQTPLFIQKPSPRGDFMNSRESPELTELNLNLNWSWIDPELPTTQFDRHQNLSASFTHQLSESPSIRANGTEASRQFLNINSQPPWKYSHAWFKTFEIYTKV